MPANAALTGTELTRLASTEHLCDAYLSYIPDTEIGHATVDAGFVAAYPLFEVAVTSASADWDTAMIDQTVKITDSGGTVLRGYFRLRAAPTNSVMYIEELDGDAESGITAFSQRTATIQAGDLCTALARRDLAIRKPYVVLGTIYQDGTQAVGTTNQYAPIIANVAINGLPGDFVTQVAQGGTQAISAVVAVTKWPTSSGSTLTYQWTYPASFTGVSGSTTATLAATAPVGSHFIRCSITDSIGGVVDIERWVRIHDPSDPPLSIKVGAIRDNATRQSREVTITGIQSTLSVVPPGAYCVGWGMPTWGGLDVATAAHSVQGYAVSQPFSHAPGYHESSLRIVGICGLLALLDDYAANFTYTGATDTWEHLASSLSTIQYAMYWLLFFRVANLARRHNFTPLSTGNLSGRRIQISVDPGTVYDQLKALADQVDANVGSRSDGEIIVVADPSLIDTTLRSALATRISLTNSIYQSVSVEWNRKVNKQPITVKGVQTTLAASADTQLAAAAPFEATSARQMSNLVFESQADANRRAGKYYARQTSQYGMATLEIPGNYDVFELPDMQRVDVVIPASKSPTGAAITLTCIPTALSKNYLGGKRVSTHLECEVETDGLDGVFVAVPAADTQMYGPNSNPFDTPLVAPPATWGEENAAMPFAWLGATQDGYVVAVS